MNRRLCLYLLCLLSLGSTSGNALASDEAFPGGIRRLAAASEPSRIQDLSSETAEFLRLINEYRQQNGLGTLVQDANLTAAALWLSQDMSTKGYFSHTDSLGRSAAQRMSAFGYTGSTKGENIAAGYSTAAAVMTGWKNSPGHNANMLSAAYHVIGIGLVYTDNSTYGWYWTTDFGNTLVAPMPTPGLSAPPGQTTLRLFPQPAHGKVNFTWPDTGATHVRIELYNTAGEAVTVLWTNTPGQTSLLWNTSTIKPGIYFYHFESSAQGKTSTRASGKVAVGK